MHIVIVSNKNGYRQFVPELEARTGAKVTYLENRADISRQVMTGLSPDWVSFHIGHILYRLKFTRIFGVLFFT